MSAYPLVTELFNNSLTGGLCSPHERVHTIFMTHTKTFKRFTALVAATLFAGALTVTPSTAQAATPVSSAYAPINPIRVADSRYGLGIATKIDANQTRTLTVATANVAAAGGVDSASITAVVVQITTTQTTGPGFITAFPTGQAQPLASSINWMKADHTITNLVSVPVSQGGDINIFASSSAHVVVDVQGVFTSAAQARAGRLVLLDSPARHLDTRDTTPLNSGSTTVVDLSGLVPATASAAVVNFTSVNNTTAGFVTAYPHGSDRPTTSNLNTPAAPLGAATASQGYIALSDAKFNVYVHGTTDLIIDVSGYFTGDSAAMSTDGLFIPVAPHRVLDTRDTNNVPPCVDAGRVRSGGAIPVAVASRGGVPASGVYAVAANISVTATGGAGFARTWAAGTAEPETATLNAGYANHTVANHAVTRTGDAGINLRAAVEMHIIVDVSGYFTGTEAAATTPVTCTPAEGQKSVAEKYADEIVRLTNIERAAVGAPPVEVHPLLIEAGKIHAYDQISKQCASGLLRHVGTDGSRAGDRIARSGLWNTGWGENLGCGYTDPAHLMTGWMNSTSHRTNMLNPIWTHIGVFVLEYAGQPGHEADAAGAFWAQTFVRTPCLVDDVECQRAAWASI